MSTTPITERLRSRHLLTIGQGLPELCEEAAREIERLKQDNVLLKQATEYLGQTTTATWEHDT
jgi:hypothetical protein